ncbi:MAG: hydantoinase/oxoprolinase family protein [Rhodospirillales bacterium]|jgi:N-methylhydantoinase A|nr:hydantoinase/oxoprolinase family protein [Rhodospirillales bacterium]
MSVRVGIDTGGTHTDVVLVDGEGDGVLALKVPTTPDDLSQGVLDGLGRILEEADQPASSISHFVYATTLVTNLLVEGSDIPVGLITTEGFRDILGIGRASRKPNIYDIQWAPPPPLVPRYLRLVVPERIDHQGRVVTPLDEAATLKALGQLVAAGVKSIAVCFINGYANPVHEQRVAALAARECPDLDISLSSDVVREFREYERLSTTVVNAYVASPLTRHMDGLTEKLAGNAVASTPYTMRSNGGIMTFAAAKRLPVTMTHSGPMGGIVGGTAIAAACGIGDIITLDMGGTSADVSLVAGGEPVLTTRGTVGRHPVLLPMLDLVTIGAGGGSVAWVDAGGALKVGPRSAGAVPGPACYDQGGDEPTVTDANLMAGRLNADFFLEGSRGLKSERSEAALHDKIAGPLGMTAGEAAIGIMAIAESHMVNAIKLISVERGLDPRDFTLVGFGGCGPLHAARLAEELSIGRVLIPSAPGNVSAMGLLSADVRHDMVRTHVKALDDVDPKAVGAEFEEMMERGVAALAADGIDAGRRRYLPAVDLRYKGQNYELTLPFPGQEVGEGLAGTLGQAFHESHRGVYGYELPKRAIQLVNLRLTAIGEVQRIPWPEHDGNASGAEPIAKRKVLIGPGRLETVPVYRLAGLSPGASFPGPGLVEYTGSTLFVPDGWTATFDEMLNANMERDVK